jgi:hypothetical protein
MVVHIPFHAEWEILFKHGPSVARLSIATKDLGAKMSNFLGWEKLSRAEKAERSLKEGWNSWPKV